MIVEKEILTRIALELLGCTTRDVFNGNQEFGVKIVVLDHGFVYVGRASLRDGWLTVEGAQNIRYWGTTSGLGELRSGPTPKTKLDPTGTIRVPINSVIMLVDTDPGKWGAL